MHRPSLHLPLSQRIAARISRPETAERSDRRAPAIFPDPKMPIDWNAFANQFIVWQRDGSMEGMRFN